MRCVNKTATNQDLEFGKKVENTSERHCTEIILDNTINTQTPQTSYSPNIQFISKEIETNMIGYLPPCG